MKLLQKVFIVYVAFFGCFLNSAVQASDYDNKELQAYSECPPPSALWPIVCTGADFVSACAAVVVPNLVCALSGAGSVDCTIFSSVVGGIFGFTTLVLTPLTSYLWYNYLNDSERKVNSIMLMTMIDNINSIKSTDLESLVSEFPAVDADELKRKLMLGHDAGYFLYKSELLKPLKLLDKDLTKELKDEIKDNVKIGFLAGADISHIVETIVKTDISELKDDIAIFTNLFVKFRSLESSAP